MHVVYIDDKETLDGAIYYPHLLEMTTLAPRIDKYSTIPLPRPVPPPVTKATRPSNVPAGSIGVLRAGKWPVVGVL